MTRAAGFPPTSLLHPRCWPSWFAVALLSMGLLLPRRLRDRLAGWLGDLQWRRNAKARETVRLNLAQCFPVRPASERDRLAREHFRAYARAMADLPIAWWDRHGRAPARHCRINGLEHLHAARGDGRPVILLSPHITGVDFGGMAVSRHVPLATMANRLDDPVLQWLLNRARERHGRVWLREEGIRPVARALRKGQVFYYMPDEDQGARNSVFAPFFGVQKATLASLGRLARLAGATVVPIMVCYDVRERRYEVSLRPALADFPTGDDERDAATMNRTLEESIELCPAQYLWNQRLFRTRPDGTRMAYPKRAHRRR